jgi:hypothetical protein
MFFFGIVITYIGWSTKKILQNIEEAINKTAKRVDDHSLHISDLQTDIKIHSIRIDGLEREVVEIRKSGKMD